MSESGPASGDISGDDLERFLTGEIQPGTPVWRHIMADLESDPDGFVAQYLDRRAKEGIAKGKDALERVWEQTMGMSERVRNELRSIADLAEQSDGESGD